jgi:hypothetical protein
MYTKNFQMYNHTVFGVHIEWIQVLLTLKIVYVLIVLVFFKEGRICLVSKMFHQMMSVVL